MTNLVWIKNDLRIHDNRALYSACKNKNKKIIALFMLISKVWKNRKLNIQYSFLHKRLFFLQQEFLNLNISFIYRKLKNFKESIKYLLLICKKYQITSIFYNHQYHFNDKKENTYIKNFFKIHKIKIKILHDNILVNPNLIKNNLGKTYQVFSFFKKKILNILKKNKKFSILKLKVLHKSNVFFKKKKLFLNNQFKEFNVNKFPYIDNDILKKIKRFFKKKILYYEKNKDFPYLNNTSQFSVYFSLGIISIREFFNHIILYSQKKNMNVSVFLDKILWREFFKHLFFKFSITHKNTFLKNWEKKIQWSRNYSHFYAWKNGLTGIPIIDAGMRQLNKLGWMHNRLRMITANFLVKNLLINWRFGAKYFMMHLIDFDYSLNNGNWAWIASVGTDSMPYIRTFNPYLQSKKFDSQGLFIKKYIPELKNVPKEYIHNPHIWLNKNKLSKIYPNPIIDYQKNKNIFIKQIKTILYQKKYIHE
ncbi:Deoxyribodipyrimidine photo-lyase [Buchnera aphidicola (Chaitophorus sp. 3695)]|uniref:cryptochrome/photolyase family protein n=1 Tax=Buchnera aphidicola TaxID=9 RepID=UPI003463C326